MNDNALPQDLHDYLRRQLAALHANERLVFVFDPPGRLALAQPLMAGGRSWTVFRYAGNDLALRAALPRLDDLAGPALIWVTARPDEDAGPDTRLEISSLADLLTRADEWFDLSLAGVLRELAPHETWPAAEVERHAGVLAANLPAVVEGCQEARRYLPRGAALDAHTLRALALHAMQPDVSIGELFFQRDSATQVLQRYIRLAWGVAWSTAGRELLREQALLSPQVPLGNIAAWFDVPPDSLATYLYLRRFLGRARVPNIANQLRGLGALGFDPEPLEPWVEQALARWDREPGWRHQIIAAAEQQLSAEDLRRAMALLPREDSQRLWAALSAAEAPGVLYHLASAILAATSAGDLAAGISQWPAHRPSLLGDLPASRYVDAAAALAEFLDEMAAVAQRLQQERQPGAGLAGLVDWYVEGSYYDLEYACAQAGAALRRLPDDDAPLTQRLQAHVDQQRQAVRRWLQTADEALAQRIGQNWRGYLDDPRLATRVLWDLVKQRHVRPTADACVWVVIFDGMRWDSWQRVVKPRLLRLFELKEPEKAYLSLLPSWTRIARASLLAGRIPEKWQTPDGRFSYDQKLLAARMFEIPAAEVDQRLRFYSGMEADTSYRQLDRTQRFPWNVLIFNVSDDNLHQERSNLVSLNTKIAALLDDIVRTLELVVRPEDTVVLSSDHGFMELEDGPHNRILIPDADVLFSDDARSAGHPVRYRYILRAAHDKGYTFTHPRAYEAPFTVAVGQRWFQREGANQRPDRYAHGGLSLAEMVVPGVVLKRIVQERIEASIDQLPDHLDVDEGQPLPLAITLRNTGNRPVKALVEVAANTDEQPQIVQEHLEPGQQRRWQPVSLPVYRATGVSTTFVAVTLKYRAVDGAPQFRRHEIPVTVHPRRDVVEIQFGGLEDLDDLGQ
jgi:hypothetical protein